MFVARGLEPLKEVSRLRPNHVVTMGEKEKLHGMFCHGHTVGTKCTHQNPELSHVRVDMAKVGSKISHVGLRVAFVKRIRRGTYKTKDFNT